ncbi:hypothetical protein [Aureivirga marina]|uniref:hypothetical protein n=1 Tax=Aureivirga marina TaxID=1182451 RepID=UPI0018C94874|nr:hypothetical protein [Aureivirga marina]
MNNNNNNEVVLATSSENREEITVLKLKEWLNDKESYKEKLANFIYDRLYGRYLKPFDYNNKNYKSDYKNGFSIMANCCLLIETFISFTEEDFKNTHGMSERSFGVFFNKSINFSEFSKEGLTIDKYRDIEYSVRRNNSGIPQDFYENIRCGILHSGEIKNGWRISRTGKLFEEESKRINATLFLEKLENEISSFRDSLLEETDIENSTIWEIYTDKLEDIMDNV